MIEPPHEVVTTVDEISDGFQTIHKAGSALGADNEWKSDKESTLQNQESRSENKDMTSIDTKTCFFMKADRRYLIRRAN
jgi:NADPH-dependent 7-cyano-7-deazaguanine reductase QueF-like protein